MNGTIVGHEVIVSYEVHCNESRHKPNTVDTFDLAKGGLAFGLIHFENGVPCRAVKIVEVITTRTRKDVTP